MRLTVKERRALIGKTIEWGEHYDPHRGNYLLRTGVVEKVEGKNFLINDDWKYLDEMYDIRVIEE